MSIASECNRLIGLRNRIRNKLIGLGLMTASQRSGDNDLEDCTDVIEGISGTQLITDTLQCDVAGKQYAQVYDTDLRAGNIVKGVTILGIAGTADVIPPSANLQVGGYVYGGAAAPPSVIYPLSGYDGFSHFTLELTDANPQLKPANIKNGVTIMGVTGTFGATQTKNMALGAAAPSTVTPDNGYLLSSVLPSIDTSVIKAENIKSGVSILGVNGSYGIGMFHSKIQSYNLQSTATSLSLNLSAKDVTEIWLYVFKGGATYMDQYEVVAAVAHITIGTGDNPICYIMSADSDYGIQYVETGSVTYINDAVTISTGDNQHFFGSYTSPKYRQYYAYMFFNGTQLD